MKKKCYALLLVAATTLGLIGCNDKLSNIGGSIQPPSDLVTARVDTISFSARTIAVDAVFSRSTYTLLGEIQDPTYGHLKADYIAQLQSARGFSFGKEPRDGKVDSVILFVGYNSWAGDSTAWLKASAYEVLRDLPEDHYSVTDIEKYTEGSRFLGSSTYMAADTSGVHMVRIKLPLEIGQKIYDLSRTNPSVFDTDESFAKNILGPLYVTTTTGTGCVLSVYQTMLSVFYDYETTMKASDGVTDSIIWKTVSESFVNTKQQALINRFENSNMEGMLGNSDPAYAYVKSPAGVTTEITFSKEDLERALLTDGKNNRMTNDAAISIDADLPSGKFLLNPPKYLLMLPADSVKTFFPEQQTELTRPRTAFLSSDYSVSNRRYDFKNIARLLDEHLKNNQETRDGRTYITKDLVLVLVPTARNITGTSSSGTTLALDNYVFPSAVRLKVGTENSRLGIITTEYFSE